MFGGQIVFNLNTTPGKNWPVLECIGPCCTWEVEAFDSATFPWQQ